MNKFPRNLCLYQRDFGKIRRPIRRFSSKRQSSYRSPRAAAKRENLLELCRVFFGVFRSIECAIPPPPRCNRAHRGARQKISVSSDFIVHLTTLYAIPTFNFQARIKPELPVKVVSYSDQKVELWSLDCMEKPLVWLEQMLGLNAKPVKQ